MSFAEVPRDDGFPNDFIWGTATAAYQVEGATTEFGRGPSIWDRFCQKPGAVLFSHSGEKACETWHRWREDIDLIKGLGVDAYRFSISWPRIQPNGSGKPIQQSLDWYKAFADTLLDANIDPCVTLYHWDLPQALEDKGGWPERDTAFRFAEFANIMFDALGDRVSYWYTINEPWCAAFLGYDYGIHAPGIKDRAKAYRTTHHLLLAHGLVVNAFRSKKLEGKIGIVLNPSFPRPATRRKDDKLAADIASDERSSLWLDPLYGRPYPERLLSAHKVEMPIKEGDMDLISSPTDFLAVNYYNEETVEAVAVNAENPEGFAVCRTWCDQTEMNWDIVPRGLYRLLKRIHSTWPVNNLFISENGAAFDDTINDRGQIHDVKRIEYLRAHLAMVRKSIEDGIPVRGYFLWSLIDNFEWAFGYTKRFGIVYNSVESGIRIPKDSYYFYRDLITGSQP